MSGLKIFALVVGAVVISLLFLLHHSVLHIDNLRDTTKSKMDFVKKSIKSGSRLDESKEFEDFQALLVQTKKLLHEIALSGGNISRNFLHDLEGIDKKLVESHTEKSLVRCMTESSRSKLDLSSCARSLHQCHSHLQHSNIPNCSTAPKSQHQVQRSSNSNSNSNSSSGSSRSSSGITDTKPLKWLVIGIPTVGRLHQEEYLLSSLDTLFQQLPHNPHDPLYNNIIINVINLQKNTDNQQQHEVFNKARTKYGHSQYFKFSEMTSDEILPDPKGSKVDEGNANVPGYLVRRQTRNINNIMMHSLDIAEHYLFLEDDMQFCQNGLLAIQYLLNKADRYHPNWLAIRASYGMNGIFMHNKDLRTFADYLLKHQSRRPPDHLVVEWYAGETKEAKEYRGNRANIGFRFNLFNHIGVTSTLRSKKSGSFPKCFDFLGEPTVFKVEAFNPRQCPHDDLWPCNVANPDKRFVTWPR